MPGCDSLSSRAERLRLTFVRRRAVLQQRKAQRDDLKGRIEQDVANAILDVTAAAEQVEVAKATLDYAQQTLTQSQDRFSAGVTNNIEVIQAQEALATANQQYISSLYSHNIAKVLLARAVGALSRRCARFSATTTVPSRRQNPAPQRNSEYRICALPTAAAESFWRPEWRT